MYFLGILEPSQTWMGIPETSWTQEFHFFKDFKVCYVFSEHLGALPNP